MTENDHRDEPKVPRGLAWGIGMACALALLAVVLIASRRSRSASAERRELTTDVSRGAVVRTTDVVLSSATRHLTLLGEARPYAEVTLYAKVSGYLKSVVVDRGDHVHKGQILATIESPETDRALSGATAEYEQRKVTADRVGRLLAKAYVSPQEADQAKADAAVARERVESLREQQAYETLRSPLEGTITARYADPGALMQSAATSQTAALPVVTVSQTDRLRVFIYLDQDIAGDVKPGMKATLSSQAHPEIRIAAAITRLSGQLDARTRKMVAELDVDDRDGRIVPGGFLQVMLDVAVVPRPEAPVEALVVRGAATYVAVVDAHSHVHLVPVTVASNDGKIVTFASGVQPGTRVALSLGGTIADGAQVQVAADSATRGAATP